MCTDKSSLQNICQIKVVYNSLELVDQELKTTLLLYTHVITGSSSGLSLLIYKFLCSPNHGLIHIRQRSHWCNVGATRVTLPSFSWGFRIRPFSSKTIMSFWEWLLVSIALLTHGLPTAQKIHCITLVQQMMEDTYTAYFWWDPLQMLHNSCWRI